jgi:hypothetical protein
MLLFVVGCLVLGLRRARARRSQRMQNARLRAAATLGVLLAWSSVARAASSEPNAPVKSGEGELDDAPLAAPNGRMRRLVLSYNPFTLQLSRYGLNAELLLASHHGLVLSPFYAYTTTNEDSFHNVFRGFGGELGYRWYSGRNGARGFFVGPSVLLGFYEGVPARGATVPFANLGGALDVGYQAIVVDRWVVGIGGGLQYTVPTQTFPPQELPASVYAIQGLRPRLLLALGAAF